MIPNSIIIHHSASGKNTTLEQINEWHKARDFPLSTLGFYIGYHFVIFPDGSVVNVRSPYEMGAHSPPNNGKIGICVVGNFMFDTLSATQQVSLNSLVQNLKKLYSITDVKGHRECNKTECPGDNLFKWVLQQRIFWLQSLINLLLKKP
jgi:hypothetical protein